MTTVTDAERAFYESVMDNPAGSTIADLRLAYFLREVDSARYIEIGEIAEPEAPGANTGRLYVRDNGSGKTQLVVRFPSGAVQVIATEP